MSKDATIERLYILDGGVAQVDDASIYSPGVDVGKPMTLSCNASHTSSEHVDDVGHGYPGRPDCRAGWAHHRSWYSWDSQQDHRVAA